MLVVTRRAGESIMITAGEHVIEVTVLGITGGQIRLGTQAPIDVAIVRKEIAHRYDNKGRPS